MPRLSPEILISDKVSPLIFPLIGADIGHSGPGAHGEIFQNRNSRFRHRETFTGVAAFWE